MNLRQASRKLNISYPTALKYVHTGLIKATKKGGTWDVLVEDIEKFKSEGNPIEDTKEEEQHVNSD